MSTAASAFPERPCVDLHGVLGNGGNKLEPTDAVLAGHYNEGGRIECYVVLNGLPDVSVRLQVLIVDVPNAVLMCAAWCCVCRRGGDILRESRRACSCVSISVGQWGHCGATGLPSACASLRVWRSCLVGNLLSMSLVRNSTW